MRRLAALVLLLPMALVVLFLTLALVYSAVSPPSTLMLGRWLTLQPVDRRAVPLEAISPYLVQAVIASEDQRYCLHNGVDWGALRDVVDDEEGPSRGASTIPMQTVKNVFLWPGRSYVRKALEIPLAVVTDALWGKRRGLEIYLNVAEWGEGVFGAEAAARHWFGKDARALTRNEAALLAAILPNPILRSASRPSRGVRARAARIEILMRGVGGLMGCLQARWRGARWRRAGPSRRSAAPQMKTGAGSSMADDATFDLSLERIALIRRMAVAWNPAGHGAPILNPQAPYGSLDRAEDISNVTGDDEGTDEEHRALGDALAVFVANASLKPGRYAYHNPLAKLPPDAMLDLFCNAETGTSPEHITFDVSAEHLALLPHLAVRWDAENDVPGVDPEHPYGGSGDLHAEMTRHLGATADPAHLAELHREMQPALQNLLRHADIAPGRFARRLGDAG